ncbi:SMP-30/gluconolactonase/LRE family protein [Nocardia lijiangensis]|uniref:SMP-30/gluconolactonase/LRE family protein n=1 Tax=Nocardia lijiangensis TaxID=299618 RepID=UPI000830EBE1|nr:SMP-30/gluconolactonase/LRE family protein [Nocardia lijiangensis]
MSTTRTLAIAAVALAATAITACGSPDDAAPVSTAYELPGDRVYPEGIARDARTGDTYVGSYSTGTIYRATPGDERAEVFLPEGADGRKTANGMKVDGAGRLWVTDSTAGVAVYDTATRALIARFDVPGADPRFVNDVVIAPDGTAYLTDSVRAVVYRVTPDQVTTTAAQGGRGELTPRFELAGVIEPREQGSFNLNGLVVDASGRYLLVVDMVGGDLYRVDLTAAAPIRKVDLRGGDMTNADGLDLRGDTLWAAHNRTNTLSRWTVTDDGAAARLDEQLTDESLSIPTTLVRDDERMLVVASQFDKGGPMAAGTPGVFRVVAVTGI